MSLAPQELENTASKYASEAIKFDSQGARGMAITHYQHAIDALVKLLQLYPNSKLNNIYKDRCNSYHNRINALQQAHGVEPAVDPKASETEQQASVKRQENENDFEDLVMKEKPDVTWDQVIGLDDAKSALRESIVYPTKSPDLFPLGWPKGMLLYGPPGTGKTYRLKNEFFEKFTDEQSTQTKEEFCDELIQDISWWQTISVVMLDLKEAKVQEIFDHPLLQAKVRNSDNKTPKNTIWGWLQRHTKDDCPNVNFKKRDNPQFFNKDNKSTWTIDEEIAKAETPDFYEVLEKYQKFKPQIESKKRYVFTTFHQSFSY